MFFCAILICKISALLTFSRFIFQNKFLSLRLEITLVDEDLKVIQTEKLLYIEVYPIAYIEASPSLLFTGNLTVDIFFSVSDKYNFSISCEQCEIVKKYNEYFKKDIYDLIGLAPQKYSVRAYEQVLIVCGTSYFGQKFQKAVLIDNDPIYYEVGEEVYPIYIYLTFLTSGEKQLILYFNSTYSVIDYASFNVPISSYNLVEFLNTYVRFM